MGGHSSLQDLGLATPPISAALIAEAVVRAAMATGELSLLAYRDEQALKGHAAFKARWVAFAALTALHPNVPLAVFGAPLGCGFNPLPALGAVRRASWWDEGVVHRLFIDLAGAPDRRDLAPLAGLHRAVVEVLDGLMITDSKGGAA